MAENKKSAIIYTDWINIFEELEDVEAGQLIKHLFRYINDQNPEPPSRLIKLVFEPLKQSLKRDLKTWEKIREKKAESGKIGGIKSGESRRSMKQNEANEADALKTKQNEANEAVTVTVNVNDSVNDLKDQFDYLNINFSVPNNINLTDIQRDERKKKIWITLFESEGWIEDATRGIKRKEVIETKRLLTRFLSEVIYAHDGIYKPLNEIKSYFINWGAKQPLN